MLALCAASRHNCLVLTVLLSFWNVFVVWLLLLTAPGSVGAQFGGVALEGRIPAQLQGCVSGESLKVGYVHGMAALGMNDTRGVNLAVTLRTLPSIDPKTMLIELSASSWGRPLGTRQLRVKVTDCAALPRGFGDIIARMAYEATARDAGRQPLLLAPPPFQAQTITQAEATGSSEHVALGIGAGVVGGLLPSAALGLQLQAATPNYPVSLRVKLGMIWPQRHDVLRGAIEANSFDLTLEMCPSYRPGSWERLMLRICVGPRVGVAQARGRDFEEPTESLTRGFLYVGLSPEVSLRLTGSTWLQLGGGLALNVIRPHLLIGVDTERRSLELPNFDPLRREVTASIVQVL
jgi:hypothetical protein